MDFKLPVFKCPFCGLKRQGEPIARPELLPEPGCRYCVERFEKSLASSSKNTITVYRRPRKSKSYAVRTNITHPEVPLGYARPNKNDPKPPELTQYLYKWRIQRGRCTDCRHRFDQMYAVWSRSGRKLTGLRCKSCYESLQSRAKQSNSAVKKQIPEYWPAAPWFMREFMWQNPSVRAEFEQLGLTKAQS